MRRLLAGFAFGAGLATLAFLVARFAAPGRRELELDVSLLVLGALTLFELVLATHSAYPREGRSALAAALARERPGSIRPLELERLERELSMATTTAFDVHFRLRPTLRAIALQRLADRRGLRLDAGGSAIEQALGEDLWELVRADRDPPDVRYGPGLERSRLRRAVEQLEAL